MRALAAVALAALSCGGGAPRGAAPAAPAPPPVVQAPPRPAPASDPLNLGFEDGFSGWAIDGQGGSAEIAEGAGDAHTGARSLRLSTTVGGTFVVARTIPLEDARGRRLLVRAWARTDGNGQPILLVRTDGSEMGHSGLMRVGGEWSRIEAFIDVPLDATAARIGFTAVSRGTAWIDDVEVAVVQVPRFVVDGVVLDPAGRPVPGAVVAAHRSGDGRTELTRSDAEGRYRFRVSPGLYALTATSEAGFGAFDTITVNDADLTRRLSLQTSGFTITGAIQGRLDPTGIQVEAAGLGTFVTTVDAGRRFVLKLPVQAQRSRIALSEPGWVGNAVTITTTANRDLVLLGGKLTPPPEEAVTWAKQAATAPTDAAALRKLVGDARIVALGQPAYGLEEVFARHLALIELLVAEGFTTVALDVDMAEALALSRYVRDGSGDPHAAVARFTSASFRNEGTVALALGLRAWNADPAHKVKLELVGADTSRTSDGWTDLGAYLARVDPSLLDGELAPLRDYADVAWRSSPAEVARMTEAGVALVKAFEKGKKRWIKASSAAEWAELREVAESLRDGLPIIALPDGPNQLETMRAQDVLLRRMLERRGKKARIVFLAQNGYIGAGGATDALETGKHLRDHLGPRYVAVATLFGEGSAQVWGDGGVVTTSHFGEPDAGDAAQLFRRAGLASALLDLRAAPAGVVGEWLADLHLLREYLMSGGPAEGVPDVLAGRYDAVLYVDEVTAVEPIEK